MKKVKVSIIVPVYNASKYLDKCLDSIINQSYDDIEIILVNDGSTDNSGKICDNYAKTDKRIIVHHQENSGVSVARNNGILKAHGEYISFIDSDDLVHPDYVKKLVENINEDILPVCEIEKFQDEVIFSKDNDKKIKLDKNSFIELGKMSLLNTPCCKLYKLDIIKKNKVMFRPKLSLGEDLLFNLDYLKYINKIIVVNQKLYFYRRSDSNTLSSVYYPNMLEIQLLLFDRYTEFFKPITKDKEKLTIYDSSRFVNIIGIIDNEFANGNVSFINRYKKARELLKSDELKERLKDIRYPNERLYYFLFKNRLLLIYRLVKKINK